MTAAELLTYYSNLLIVQFATKTKARGTVGALVTEVVADLIVQAVQNAFDLDTAVGAQLTTLAEYRGLTRSIFGLDVTKNYFSLVPVADDPEDYFGFATVDMAPGDIPDYFLRLVDITALTYTLNDGELRALIQYVADLHKVYQSVGQVQPILSAAFGGWIYARDNMNMSVTYEAHLSLKPPGNDLFQFVVALGLLPTPAGVAVSVVEVP